MSRDQTAPRSNRYASPSPRRTGVTNRLREDVVGRYRRGETSREVAEGLGIAKTTVLRVLTEAGVEVRPQGVRYR